MKISPGCVFIKGVLKICNKKLLKYAGNLQENTHAEWVFSCKFPTYFQNTFSLEHLWRGLLLSISILSNIQKFKEDVWKNIYFLTAIWLPHDRLQAILTALITRYDINHCVLTISTRRSPEAS